MVLVLTGKAGAGKDTIKNILMDMGMEWLPSHTTRPMREGEVEGKEYHFLTDKEWNDKDYIESRIYTTEKDGKPVDYRYGTPKTELDKHKLYITIKDKDGALALRNYYGDKAVWIAYIDAPFEVRTERAKNRGSFDALDWEKRREADEKQFNDVRYADIQFENISKELLSKNLIGLYELMDSMNRASLYNEPEQEPER